MNLKRYLVRYQRLPRRHRIRWDEPVRNWRDSRAWIVLAWAIVIFACFVTITMKACGWTP